MSRNERGTVSTATDMFREKQTDGRILIGVADIAVTTDESASLITYALGSCIGVTIYDPVAKVGGMLHFMLPSAKINPDKGNEKPAMFGDMGIPLLFKACYENGATKERLVVCAAGGAEVLSDSGNFKIGSRNRTMLRKLFWKNNILLTADDTGGSNSRTIILDMGSGQVNVRSKGTETVLWSL